MAACQSEGDPAREGLWQTDLGFIPKEPPHQDLARRMAKIRLMSKDLKYGLLLPPDSVERHFFRLADKSFSDAPHANAMIITDRESKGWYQPYGFMEGLKQGKLPGELVGLLQNDSDIPESHPLRLIRYYFILDPGLLKEDEGFEKILGEVWMYDSWEDRFCGQSSFSFSKSQADEEGSAIELLADSLRRQIIRDFYRDE